MNIVTGGPAVVRLVVGVDVSRSGGGLAGQPVEMVKLLRELAERVGRVGDRLEVADQIMRVVAIVVAVAGIEDVFKTVQRIALISRDLFFRVDAGELDKSFASGLFGALNGAAFVPEGAFFATHAIPAEAGDVALTNRDFDMRGKPKPLGENDLSPLFRPGCGHPAQKENQQR